MRQVLKGEVANDVYTNMKVKWIGGRKPEAKFFTHEGFEMPDLTLKLGNWDRQEFLDQLLEKVGFVPDILEEEYGNRPNGQGTLNGVKYEWYITQNTHDVAAKFAAEKGGHLPVILSAEENEFLGDLAKTDAPVRVGTNKDIEPRPGLTRPHLHEFWLGATDRWEGHTQDGDWRWQYGDVVNTHKVQISRKEYAPWDKREPSNTGNGEHCLTMNANRLWNDVSCTTLHTLVIQYPPGSGDENHDEL